MGGERRGEERNRGRKEGRETDLFRATETLRCNDHLGKHWVHGELRHFPPC